MAQQHRGIPWETTATGHPQKRRVVDFPTKEELLWVLYFGMSM
jgi:hypothetical protein